MKKLITAYVSYFLESFNRVPKRPKLFRLGSQSKYGRTYDLSEYYVDSEGTLYSNNHSTYETHYGSTFKTLSDGSRDTQGHVVNTLRDLRGRKVTLRREVIIAWAKIGMLEEVR